MDIWLEDPRCGDLSMERDTGLVYRHVGEEREPCGFVEDDDSVPPDLHAEWAVLRDIWRDSLGGGHEREAAWGYYERLSIARMN